MRTRQNHDGPVTVCNDNGNVSALRRRQAVRPSSIMRLAIDLAGSITMTYAADGVLIMSPARRSRND
jgi:hypothetical protein